MRATRGPSHHPFHPPPIDYTVQRPRKGSDLSAPRVSVIIAAFNAARYLPATLDSVLSQTFSDFELIVVDDASTDTTASVALSTGDPRVRVIRLAENVGTGAARNRGLAEARGEYIATIDADDTSYPGRLAMQSAYLEGHPEVVLVAHAFDFVSPEGRIEGRLADIPTTDAEIRCTLLLHNPIGASTVLFRAEAARASGGYAPTGTAEDYAFVLHIADLGRLAQLPDVLGTYRRHAEGLASQQSTELRANSVTLSTSAISRFLDRDIDPAVVRAAKNEAPDGAAPETLRAGYELVRELLESCVSQRTLTEAERAHVFDRGLRGLAATGRRAGLRLRPASDAWSIARSYVPERLWSLKMLRFSARQILR